MQDTSLGARKLNSGILGASVANLSITGLQDDVVIQLRHIEPVPVSTLSKHDSIQRFGQFSNLKANQMQLII